MSKIPFLALLAVLISHASAQVSSDENHAVLQLCADVLAAKHIAVLEACADLQESGAGPTYRVMATVNRIETRREMVQGVFLTSALSRVFERALEEKPEDAESKAQYEEFARRYGELPSIVSAAIASDMPEQDALIESLGESDLRAALVECREALNAVRRGLDLLATTREEAPNTSEAP